MKFRILQQLSLIFFFVFFAIPSKGDASASNLKIILYEDGSKITDNSVISGSYGILGQTLCAEGCCKDIGTNTFYKTPVQNILTYKEWTDQYLLGVEGCEDIVTKTEDEERKANSEWNLEYRDRYSDKTDKMYGKTYTDFMVSKGFTSYAYPPEKCARLSEAEYDKYLEKFRKNAKFTKEIFIPDSQINPNDIYPLKLPSGQYDIPTSYFLEISAWVKADIVQGTVVDITQQMRKEMQKMIDAKLGYSDIMKRICREDFLKDQPSPSPVPPTSIHSTAPETTSDTAIPIAPLVAGMVFVLLLTGTLLMVSQKKGKSIKK